MIKYFLVYSFFFTGCIDKFYHAQYSLNKINSFTSTTVCEDIKNIALQKGLIQKKPKSKDIVCHFSHPNGLLIGSRILKNHIIIDIQSINIDIKPYQKEIEFLLSKNYSNYKIVH